MKFLLLAIFVTSFNFSIGQTGWAITNAPQFNNRVDDIFMANSYVGYAVCGDGQIVKTIDGGNNWQLLMRDSSVYCRSVEFVNGQLGFVGGFSRTQLPLIANVLRKTINGGLSWTDLTPLLAPLARNGICGLAAADINTIYGCGNWFGDSAYIIKSTDAGDTWSFIDMANYASSLIDMHFINKDVGFAVGKDTTQKAIILYTEDGGANWIVKYKNLSQGDDGYCWKIQQLNAQVYYASIESFTNASPKILRSTDGGMSWNTIIIQGPHYYIEGAGFINTQKGWAGGGSTYSFETSDGGVTWKKLNICPSMNRVFRVSDTVLFATGDQIWKYNGTANNIIVDSSQVYINMNCYPNPALENMNIDIWMARPTQVVLMLFDDQGKRLRIIENAHKQKGSYKYSLSCNNLPDGYYLIVLKTHEEKRVQKVFIGH